MARVKIEINFKQPWIDINICQFKYNNFWLTRYFNRIKLSKFWACKNSKQHLLQGENVGERGGGGKAR